jgi:bifunctional oligoribonuclease and PAP phosphatase NrnA
MRSIFEFGHQLENNTNIVIITHTQPDADALCSAISLRKLILSNYNPKQDKVVDLLVDAPSLDDTFLPVVKGEIINVQSKTIYDLAIGVDCPSTSRFGKYESVFINAKDSVNIDHHITNNNFANNNLVLVTSSTCELIYRIMKLGNKIIGDDVCKLIYAGIITDTADLTTGNVTTDTHKTIAELFARNLNYDAISEYFFKSDAVSKAFLLEKALHSLTFILDDRVAIMKLTKTDFRETDSTFTDSQGLINNAINIKGVDIAIILIKQEDNSYYCSLRGKSNVNVASIAQSFGGGGHENMAAFPYKGLLTDFWPPFTKACEVELNKLPPISKIPDDLFAPESNKEQNNQTIKATNEVKPTTPQVVTGQTSSAPLSTGTIVINSTILNKIENGDKNTPKN